LETGESLSARDLIESDDNVPPCTLVWRHVLYELEWFTAPRLRNKLPFARVQ